ncbi:GlcG/HbpS family heme-binding protein [Paucibacter sp. Y2R2-4]|uniref:GlcG/HbpS family heme-binding protein n=1 Tax=Paucibacter sp. Y2R2-4 TaxID=2893553 RepID=UPI0021E3869E|nr:heme-binding protein [Paucibacter sp. Y2R2-4]MCV2348298.1 heme-binding protein [Paucibacter sp. Y2R2-4]
MASKNLFAPALLSLGAVCFVASPAGAQTPAAATAAGTPAAPVAAASAPPPVPPARGPAFAEALELARVALQSCSDRQQRIAVSVLDSAGVHKVLLAADGASARGVQSSTNKALTALQFKAATSALGEQAKSDKALGDQLAANPALNARAGGIVLRVGEQIIGAVGVGGARGSENDEACALAGLAAVQSRLK